MKKFLLVLSITIISLTHYGCNGCANTIKHLQSEVSGLNRTITLFTANGDTLGSWNTSSVVEDHGGSCSFLFNGKSMYVAGTYTIQEN